ncbi:MAG: tol-pal system protein YbgF [Cellvibrionaceae bacterium]
MDAQPVLLQLAQVEVIESSPAIRPIGQPRPNRNNTNTNTNTNTDSNANPGAGTPATNLQSELYHQLQVLQEEVQALRGMVEEQAYQLQQLKQQRMDDYVDLDRRISQLGGNGGAQGEAGSSGGGSTDSDSQRVAGGSGAIPADEFASYSAAVDLATKQQEFDRAIVALNEHLERYPDGRYAANAYYWLGQIYFVQGNMEEARREFSRVVNDFSNHNKAPEARYKLGQVYFQLGDKAQAKTLLDRVASGDSDSAPLARNFLRQNYP